MRGRGADPLVAAGAALGSGLTGVPAGLLDGDDNSMYAAMAGLELSGSEFAVDTTAIQARMSDTCAEGNAIYVIKDDGRQSARAKAEAQVTSSQ